MQPVDAIDLRRNERAFVDHFPRAAPALFAGLEQQHDIAFELIAVERYPLCQKQKDRHMSVVAAAVHHALIARAEAAFVLLGVFHSVHIGAECYRAVCVLGVKHSLEPHFGEHLQLIGAARFDYRLYVFVRFLKIEADLGYSVQVAAYLDAVVLHAEYLFAYLHLVISPLQWISCIPRF